MTAAGHHDEAAWFAELERSKAETEESAQLVEQLKEIIVQLTHRMNNGEVCLANNGEYNGSPSSTAPSSVATQVHHHSSPQDSPSQRPWPRTATGLPKMHRRSEFGWMNDDRGVVQEFLQEVRDPRTTFSTPQTTPAHSRFWIGQK
eukprot:NODE_9495_length_639_cov_77.647287_g9229_i0.p1 GENE.NODE_9495_length_639_cov_77.647287_g9229_i0~~NODE_9495_length_639_cov_77.647287_g9229_i0.p1  ORF type:complete len:146 (+),score=14.51 NODE_9495_length_639_cov_77.647287_g9229_i0:89-526(+)